MNRHPTSLKLRRFLGGGLAPSAKKAVLRHLGICPACRLSLAKLNGECLDAEYNEVLDRAQARTIGRQLKARRERERAAPIVAALASGDLQIVSLTRWQAIRLRGVALIDLLLAKSQELRSQDPSGMVQLAELALLGAARLSRWKYGAITIADYHARCWAELANALRVSDDLISAGRAISHAQSWMDRGTGDLLLLGRIADVTASLLSAERRFDQAAVLLRQLCALYREIGDPHRAGRTLISLGTMYGFADEPERGLTPLLQGIELIDAKREPSLLPTSLKNLVWLLAESGQFRRARHLLWRLRGASLLPVDHLNVVRLRWVEGKIFRGLGDQPRAEGAFLEAKASFARAGLVYQSALVSLELAQLWLEQGRREQLPPMVAEMIATFRALRIAREAIAALLVLREACTREAGASDEIVYRIRVVAACLKELEREPVNRKRPSSASDTRH